MGIEAPPTAHYPPAVATGNAVPVWFIISGDELRQVDRTLPQTHLEIRAIFDGNLDRSVFARLHTLQIDVPTQEIIVRHFCQRCDQSGVEGIGVFKESPACIRCECVQRVLLGQDLAKAAVRQISPRIRSSFRLCIRKTDHEAAGIQAVNHDPDAGRGIGQLPQSIDDVTSLRLKDEAVRQEEDHFTARKGRA